MISPLRCAPVLLTLALQAQQPAPDPHAAEGTAARTEHAQQMLEKGDYKAAEADLTTLAQASPNDAEVQFDLGFAAEHNGEDALAAKAYAAAAAADPTLPQPRLALGLLEARQGRNEAARTDLQAVAAMGAAAPSLRARALRALARLDEARNPDEARNELLQATKLNGEAPDDASLTAAIAAGSNDAPDAEGAYRQALAQQPGDLDATVGLATVLEREGKLEEADALLRPALAAHPDDTRVVARMVALDAAEDKSAEALGLLTGLRTRDPQAEANPALTRLLAHLELVSGDAATAEPLYRQLLATDPNDPRLLDDLGSTLVRQRKFADAETVLGKAVGLRTEFHDDEAWGETAGHLAFAASRNGDPRGALQALALRATVLPNSAATLFLEATAHDTLHQIKAAQQSYRAFLAAANGKLPNEEFEARHRLVTLEHEH